MNILDVKNKQTAKTSQNSQKINKKKKKTMVILRMI